jgi:hypothetical protein
MWKQHRNLGMAMLIKTIKLRDIEPYIIAALVISIVFFIAGYDNGLRRLDEATKQDGVRILCDGSPMYYVCKSRP